MVGLDFKSVKFNGFGSGLDMGHRFGWISNRYYLTDSDLGLDSLLPSGWVGVTTIGQRLKIIAAGEKNIFN